MEPKESPAHKTHQKRKKEKKDPATPEELLKEINEIRQKLKLPQIKQQDAFVNYASALANGDLVDLNNGTFVVTSLLHFYEAFDGKTPTSNLVKKWFNSSQKRSVLLGPGNMGCVAFIQGSDDGIYIYVIVASLFH
ncbi:hypothetical protein GPJ56_006709 [Histomonas meleagridis]|uniref:uncharacterized protein n=1 Tax=Histomonas meleagridis TaxID=135588 RepID=UPI00355A9614|nr:hypothetical protein GPJ56_006709 [Histomonas meleagridis]KAH0806454.1 hypothetical protein GO595_000616 [Histomonas meleagridis]